MIYEEVLHDEDLDEEDKAFFFQMLTKTLNNCASGGVVHDTIVTVTDTSLDLKVSGCFNDCGVDNLHAQVTTCR